MYPAPTTTVFFGTSSKSKNPSLVIPNSCPGMFVGIEGLPPVAIRMWFEVIVFPSIFRVCGPTKEALPTSFSTLSFCKLLS